MKRLKLFLFVLVVVGCSGCMYVDVPGRLTAWSLFKDIELKEIYLEDPNEVSWLTGYESDAADAKIKYNPLTGSLELAAEGETDANH